jgi:uncharacterized protein YjdB
MEKNVTHPVAANTAYSENNHVVKKRRHLKRLMLFVLLLSGLYTKAQTNGLNFDGVNDYVTIPSPYYTFGNEITVEWWVNITGATGYGPGIGQSIENVDNMTTSNVWLMHYGGSLSDGFGFFVNDNGTWRSAASGPLSAGWHHYAGVASPSGIKFYIDGVLVGSGPGIAGGIINVPSSVIQFGKDVRWSDRFLNCSMDEVRIWNRALCQNEIQNNMSCESPSGTGLVEYYKFNEGTAGGTNTGLTTIADYSGNGRNGVLSNFALSGSSSNWVTGHVSGSCSAFTMPITGTTAIYGNTTTTLGNTVSGGTWSSTNTSVATVTSSGVVTGASGGTSTISYVSACGTATTAVTVYPAATGLKFDGTNDNVGLGSSITNLNDGDFTIEMWIKTTATNAGMFTCENGNGSWEMGERCFYLDGSGRPSFVGSWSGYILSTMSVNDGNWHHIAATWDYSASGGSVAKMYIDGVDRTSGSTGYSNYAGNLGTFYLGRPNFAECSNFFNGAMDEVRIWSRALCQSELGNNRNCELTGAQTGLAAYYKLNQGFVGATNSSETSLIDASGNAHTGTLNNFGLSGTSSNWVAGNISGTCSAFTPAASTGSFAICTGSTTTLSNSVSGGTWSSGTTSVATVGLSNGVVLGLIAGTSNITYTSSCGITISVVTVNAYPTVAAITGNTTLSTAITTQLADVTSGGVWASGNGSVATVNSSTGVVSGVSTGTAPISYTVTSNGCATTTTTNITVNTPSIGMHFDNANDRIDGNNSALPQGSSARTIEAWIKLDNTSGSKVVFNWGSFLNNKRSGLLISNNNLFYVGESNDLNATSATVAINTWTHVAVTLMGTSVKFYVNGVLRQSGTLALTPNTTGSSWSISNTNDLASTREPFGGSIDEVRVWNTVRSASEIQSNMNCDVSQQSGLVAYYRFDQGTASGTNTGTTILNDYSGNNSCGTISNMNLSGGSSNFVSGAIGSCNTITLVQNITGSTPVCAGSAITLASTTTGGLWSSSNTSVATVAASTGLVNGVTAGNATITYSVCGASVTVEVTVNPSPSTIGGTAAVCMGAVTTLTNMVSGGSWTIADASKAAIDASGVVTPGADGTTTVTYTLPAGCFATRELTVNPLPAAITGASAVCEGLTTVVSNTTFDGAWSSSNTSAATIDGSGIVSGILAGNATISYTLPTGCYTTAGMTVNPSPSTIGGTAAVCMGSVTTLTNSVSGGSWTIADAGMATIDASGVVTPGTDGTSTVTYTLPAGCFATRELTVNPLPVSITGTTDMCNGNYTTLSNTSTGGAWSSASASIVTVNSSTGVVTSHNEGITTISYTLPTGCYVTSTVNNMVAAISGASSICSGLYVTLSDATTGGSWSSSDATVAPINISGIITAGTGGSATITYTTGSGCYRTQPFTVVTTPAPITGTLIFCVGSSTTLATANTGGTWSAPGSAVTSGPSATGVITGLSTGTNSVSYSLSPTCRTSVVVTVNAVPQVITGTNKACPGTTATLATVTTGGTWSSSNATLASVDPATGVVTGVATGTSTISYTLGTGCARTILFTVNPTPPAIGGPSFVCAGSIATLTNSASGVSWSSSNASVASISGSGVLNGVSAGVATITFTSGTGCFTTTNITVGSVPAITGASSVCIGAVTTLANVTSGGVWSSSNTAKATVDANGVVTGIAEGPASIIYAASGCSASKSVYVNPLPTVITGYQTACVGTTTTLNSVGNTGTWSSSTASVATVNSVTGVVFGVSAGTSTMTYTVNSTGCARSAIVTVSPFPGAITGTVVACAGTTASLSNTVSGGSWTSANTAIATVGSATGVVTGVGAGTVTISYALGTNCKVMASFTTRALPAVIGGTPSVCTPLATTLSDVTSGGTWSSSNTAVATVGSAGSVGLGAVSGVSTGTATISYMLTATGCYRTSEVTVNAGLNPGTISPATNVVLKTISTPHTATLISSGAAGGTWTSSNPAVATVDPSTGLVTAVAAGTATISYSVAGACTNTVTKNVSVVASRPGEATAGEPTAINLYPNPTSGSFTFETAQAGDLHIFTIDGRQVASYSVEKGATQVTLPAGIAAGVYMCRYTAADGSTTMIRLVFEH